MGFFGLIGGFVSSVVSAVGSLCSSVGGALFSSVSSAVATIVGPIVGLPEVLLVINTVCAIVNAVAEALGIKKEEETPEEIGMKAEKADKKPEDFDSVNEYIDYLRNEVEIDKEKLNNLSDEEKAKYSATGMGVYIEGIKEKYNIEIPDSFWRTAADRNMTGDEVKGCLDTFEGKNISVENMEKYLENKPVEGKTDYAEVSDCIMSGLKEANPEMSEEQIAERLVSLSSDL